MVYKGLITKCRPQAWRPVRQPNVNMATRRHGDTAGTFPQRRSDRAAVSASFRQQSVQYYSQSTPCTTMLHTVVAQHITQHHLTLHCTAPHTHVHTAEPASQPATSPGDEHPPHLEVPQNPHLVARAESWREESLHSEEGRALVRDGEGAWRQLLLPRPPQRKDLLREAHRADRGG